ncbi:hypothetical protein M513_08633 [Trichuris suis]|uniref:Uncharacterized protein n=1 Tax=Trichuris suis TaxID=68888 RepID=A0A085LZL0_9BILA|nr:hypothetical protein M513_08633 [Trichuris suis]
MKPRLVDHLKRLLPDKANRTISYFLSLRDKLNKQPEPDNMLLSTSQVEEEDGLRASYNISFLIAKSGKARTIGEELLLPVVTEVFNTVLHKPATDIIKKSPLSNDAVQRRIDEMGKDTEGALCSLLKTTQFSLHLDESVLPGNEALLLAYVRFIKDEHMVQELLFARELMTDTKEESTFRILKEVFAAKKIPLTNAVGPPYPRLLVPGLSAYNQVACAKYRIICKQPACFPLCTTNRHEIAYSY